MKLNPNKTEEAPANFPDDPLIETDSEPESDRDFIDIFEYSDEQHDNTAPAKRRVNIVLRDAHDVEGKGTLMQDLPRSGRDALQNQSDLVKETDTPEALDLWHGTTTEIKVWSSIEALQCVACQKSGYPSTASVDKQLYKQPAPTNSTSPAATRPATITLHVADQTGFKTEVKMISTVSFAYLMNQYAVAAYRERSECRFLLEGERLTTKESPKDLDMESGDTIDVYFEQIGGRS